MLFYYRHRGIAMKVSTVSYTYLPPPYTLPKPPQKSLKSVYLALDQIVDPYNLGSIIRTSFYYGVSGIILSEKSHSPLSPLVSSASCGSMEYMVEQKRLFQTNLPEFLGFYYKKVFTYKVIYIIYLFRIGQFIVLLCICKSLNI